MLFPAIVTGHPALADTVAALERDHRMLDHLIGSYQQALEQSADAASLLRHLDGLDVLMESHFRNEARILLPVLEGLRLDASATDAYGPLAE